MIKGEYRDFFGNTIKAGDYIAYAVTSGRSGVLKIGRVTELSKSNGWSEKDKAIIKAKTAMRWSWKDKYEVQNGGSPVAIRETERSVVLQDSQVPTELKELLA
jgi:hypothetical protein